MKRGPKYHGASHQAKAAAFKRAAAIKGLVVWSLQPGMCIDMDHTMWGWWSDEEHSMQRAWETVHYRHQDPTDTPKRKGDKD